MSSSKLRGARLMEIDYPFKPKSNKSLIPGQFWAIPMQNGKFACGRVVQVTGEYYVSPTKTFLAGLMDWVGDEPPTSDLISGRKTLDQGVVHINSIFETGLNDIRISVFRIGWD